VKPLELGLQEAPGLEKWANLSPDGRYRYLLGRQVLRDGNGTLLFIMLNPLTADADLDDPTIRRCIGFARRDGYERMEVVNVYALRATDPAALKTALAPGGGPENGNTIAAAVARAHRVVYAWGTLAPPHDWMLIHDDLIKPTGKTPYCLGQTKYGCPKHPLYIRGDQPLVPFEISRVQ
jgi:hypothetical protein